MVFKDRTFRSTALQSVNLKLSYGGETYKLTASNPVGSKVVLFIVTGDYLDVEQMAVTKIQQLQDQLMAQLPLQQSQKGSVQAEVAALCEEAARRFFHLIQTIDLQTRECRHGCDWDYAKLADLQCRGNKGGSIAHDKLDPLTEQFPSLCVDCASIVDRIERLWQVNIRTHFNTSVERLQDKVASRGALKSPVSFARWTIPHSKPPSKDDITSARSTVRAVRQALQNPLPALLARVFGALREIQAPGEDFVLVLQSNTDDFTSEFDARYRLVQASTASGYALTSCHALPTIAKDYHSTIATSACVALNQIADPDAAMEATDDSNRKITSPAETFRRLTFTKIGATEYRTLAVCHFQAFHGEDLRKLLYDGSVARLVRLLILNGDDHRVSQAFRDMAADLMTTLVRRSLGGHHDTPDYIDHLFEVWWDAPRQSYGVKALVGETHFSAVHHARAYAKATGDMDSPTIARESKWQQQKSPRVIRTRV